MRNTFFCSAILGYCLVAGGLFGHDECTQDVATCQSCECLITYDPWSGSVAIGYNGEYGNSKLDSIQANADADLRFYYDGCPMSRWHLEGKYERTRGEKDDDGEDEDFVDKGRVQGAYERWFASRWVWRIDEEISFDRKKDLDARFDTTVGLGYYVCQGDCFSLELLAGIGHSDEFYKSPKADVHDLILPVGWELDWTLPNEWVFHHEVEFDPNLEHWQRYRIYSDVELKLPISSCWCLAFEYEYEYFNRPAKNKGKWDSGVKTKLVYRF